MNKAIYNHKVSDLDLHCIPRICIPIPKTNPFVLLHYYNVMYHKINHVPELRYSYSKVAEDGIETSQSY